jgi:TfoX/Sxy family transcriptional regulator of competence genes
VPAYDTEIAERVRHALADRADVVEKRMVGGLSFLVGGNMCCGVTGQRLMVRVGAEGRDSALTEPHVWPMEFAGRSLRGFVCVDQDGFRTEAALAAWIQRGLDVVALLPAKPARPARRRTSHQD